MNVQERIEKKCTIRGCGKKHKAKGMCDMHYRRNLRGGSPGLVGPMQSGRGEGEAFLVWLSKNCDSTDCIKWPFGTDPSGYGKIFFNGKSTSASRAMCIIHRGPPKTKEMQASHVCGKGHAGCVNPNHIVWATCRENLKMKKDHGTWQSRENHPSARLTERDVRDIRAARNSMTRRQAAEKWGVHYSTIQAVVALDRDWETGYAYVEW